MTPESLAAWQQQQMMQYQQMLQYQQQQQMMQYQQMLQFQQQQMLVQQQHQLQLQQAAAAAAAAPASEPGSFVRLVGVPLNEPRPPPPDPVDAPKKRVMAEFDDMPAGSEMTTHASVMDLDLVDLHEFGDGDLDLALPDHGGETNATDAGIIERGKTVQPAVVLPEGGGGNDTVTVQARTVNPTAVKEEEEASSTVSFSSTIMGAALALFGGSFRMLGASGKNDQVLASELHGDAAAATAATTAAATTTTTDKEPVAEPQAADDPAQPTEQEPPTEEEPPVEEQQPSEEEVAAAAAAALAAMALTANPNLITVEVRTLSGKEATYSDLDRTVVTLGELRQLIFDSFPGIELDEQRLLLRSKLLEILEPSTLLIDADVHHGDVIRLVKQLQGPGSVTSRPGSVTFASPPVSSLPEQPQQLQPLQILTVLVPLGRGPGDKLRIVPQGRGPMIVTVPAGLGAGDRFRVMLPPDDPAELYRAEQALEEEQRRIQQEADQDQRRMSLKPQIMAVVVPRGMKAGQMMDVNVPGRGRVRVTIPKGVKAGQQFKFRLPAML